MTDQAADIVFFGAQFLPMGDDRAMIPELGEN
jgi:hypothetical protein